MKYVYRDGKIVPKVDAPRGVRLQIMKDEQEGVSPIDGTVLSSRSHVREHCKRHGVEQVGNDMPARAPKPVPIDPYVRIEWSHDD